MFHSGGDFAAMADWPGLQASGGGGKDNSRRSSL